MSGNKTDLKQLEGILKQFDSGDIRAVIARRGLSTATFVPVSVSSPTGLATEPTAIDVPCPTPNAVVSTNSPAANVSVTLNNIGDCTVKITLKAGQGERGSVIVDPGKSGAIATTGVDRVEIDCLACQDGCELPRCKFTDSITWS